MKALKSAMQEVNGVTPHEGAALILDKMPVTRGPTLPPSHYEILQWSNGLEVYDGYYRLFGIDSTESIDSVWWNQDDCWKFAWNGRCSAFWCFGETAWGDQYAYSTDSLRRNADGPVYFIDAVSMTAEIIAGSFAEFFEREFLRVAREPYDKLIVAARQKVGPIDSKSHLVYVPSLLLGGTETVDNITTMNARAAMISNGDLAIQVDAGPADGCIKAVEEYVDELGRARLRLVWDN
jgi:hypothetical protein